MRIKSSIPSSKSWEKEIIKPTPKKHKEGDNKDTCRNDEIERKFKLIRILFPWKIGTECFSHLMVSPGNQNSQCI